MTEIRYFDTVTIKHKDSKQFLHSHVEKYPLRYDDGRISSQGQQVTCYPHNDTNNQWQILPTKEIPETGRGRVVRHSDVIQLKHIVTQTLLMTHDVASPLMATNQEFTTVDPALEERRNDTLFQLQLNDANDGTAWKSLSGHFKLQHLPTKVLLWTHPKALPEWAFGQQEVNGNKNQQDKTTFWYVDDILEDGTGNDFKNRTVHVEPKVTKKRSFVKKFVELQILMLQHNAGLTADHPYASDPIEWPFSLSGVSFWTNNEKQQQIYMIGNLLGFWICSVGVSIFVGIMGADMLARRRGLDPIEDSTSLTSTVNYKTDKQTSETGFTETLCSILEHGHSIISHSTSCPDKNSSTITYPPTSLRH
jgi:dolichyl-phosphate-mannose-protein mannosyltransferase